MEPRIFLQISYVPFLRAKITFTSWQDQKLVFNKSKPNNNRYFHTATKRRNAYKI